MESCAAARLLLHLSLTSLRRFRNKTQIEIRNEMICLWEKYQQLYRLQEEQSFVYVRAWKEN